MTRSRGLCLTRTHKHALRSARGFTLLEVLIAVVLSLLLMAGLWALFDTYQALFSRGQAKVENAQLIRALFERIARDLQCAIPDSAAGVPGQSASVRRFGLFGTQSALQVDVLEMNDAYGLLDSTDQNEPRQAQRRQNVPELHTVQYLFQQPGDAETPESGVRSGLVRRELDWETPAGDRRVAGDRGVAGDPTRPSGRPRLGNGSRSTLGSSDPMNLSAGEFDLDDDSLLQVPEVVKLEFRYYDGNGWTTQWNSLAQKSLPVAVEVALTLKRPQESSRRRTALPASAEKAPAENDLSDEASEEDVLDEVLGLASEADSHQYRLLVCLPAASRLPASVRSPRGLPGGFALPPPLPPPQTVPRPPSGPAPGLSPARPPSSGSLRAVLPDQWMRGGT